MEVRGGTTSTCFMWKLGKNALDVEIQNQVQQQRAEQHGEDDQRDDVHLVTYVFEVIEKLLLFQGIPVRGLSDHLKLIFDALEGPILFGNSSTQLDL